MRVTVPSVVHFPSGIRPLGERNRYFTRQSMAPVLELSGRIASLKAAITASYFCLREDDAEIEGGDANAGIDGERLLQQLFCFLKIVAADQDSARQAHAASVRNSLRLCFRKTY